MSKELKCWSCKEVFTLSEHADCNGCCWKCGVEIDLQEMDISSAPQPPALGGEPEVVAWRDSAGRCITHGGSGRYHKPLIDLEEHRAHLATAQAEIERLRAGGALIAQHMNEYKKERDRLKALLKEMRTENYTRLKDIANMHDRVDAALSKQAGSDNV